MTDHRIPLAGVIGSPVAHSRSPRLHGHWLRQYGLAGFYVPMDLAPEKLETAMRTMPDLGFVGVNVTIPYKEKVMEIADLVSDRATLIGAANTIIFRKDGRIHADNTDGYGFLERRRELVVVVVVVVLGFRLVLGIFVLLPPSLAIVLVVDTRRGGRRRRGGLRLEARLEPSRCFGPGARALQRASSSLRVPRRAYRRGVRLRLRGVVVVGE